MSDLVLVLHERIEAVRRGVRIGTVRLQAAQDEVGLSNERLARLLYISERTWRRWKEEGEIPREHLPAVARELRLVIESAPEQDGNHDGLVGARLDALERRQEEVVDALASVVRTLDALTQELRRGQRGNEGQD